MAVEQGHGRTVELVSVEPLSPTVKAFRWRCVDGAPLAYRAGQWLDFDVETPRGLVRRAYSIASAPDPNAPSELETAVTLVAGVEAASEALHALRPGVRLEVDGPYGFFTREGAERAPALLVGTGTGLCPLRAMLEDELRHDTGPRLTLLFGCRSEADILWRRQLEDWSRTRSRFSCHVTLSRPGPEWRGLRGYVQEHVSSLVPAQDRPHVYVCGLQKMVTEVRRVLKQELDYDRKLVHSERYD
jgi:ferredoxin-NADP reductase